MGFMEIQTIRRIVKAILVLVVTSFFMSCNNNIEQSANKLPTDLGAMQKQMIGQLSGEFELKKGIKITDRWSNKQKRLVREYLKEIIIELGLQPLEHSYNMPNLNQAIDLILEPFKGVNVYTTLPATTASNEYVILGAHYDTGKINVPGAIDNASGMTLIYSVVKKLSKLPNRHKNVILVFFDQEEEESIGSSAFAKLLIKEKFDIHSVHTFDMIGWDSDNNKEVELEMPTQLLKKAYEKNAQELKIPIYTTQINSSDHFSFIKKGINTVGVSQAYAKRDNSGKKDTKEDKYELVNFDYLQSTTRLAFEVIKDLISK